MSKYSRKAVGDRGINFGIRVRGKRDREDYQNFLRTLEGDARLCHLLNEGYIISGPPHATVGHPERALEIHDESSIIEGTSVELYNKVKQNPNYVERLILQPGCGPEVALMRQDHPMRHYEVKIEYVTRPDDPIEL